MPTFSGNLNILPTYQRSLTTSQVFDTSVQHAQSKLEKNVQNPSLPITVTMGEVQDFTPQQLEAVGLNPHELSPSHLVATLEGTRELKGVLPALRRWFTGFRNPTAVHELLMLDDGKKGLTPFIKQTHKALKSETFWSKFVPSFQTQNIIRNPNNPKISITSNPVVAQPFSTTI